MQAEQSVGRWLRNLSCNGDFKSNFELEVFSNNVDADYISIESCIYDILYGGMTSVLGRPTKPKVVYVKTKTNCKLKPSRPLHSLSYKPVALHSFANKSYAKVRKSRCCLLSFAEQATPQVPPGPFDLLTERSSANKIVGFLSEPSQKLCFCPQGVCKQANRRVACLQIYDLLPLHRFAVQVPAQP